MDNETNKIHNIESNAIRCQVTKRIRRINDRMENCQCERGKMERDRDWKRKKIITIFSKKFSLLCNPNNGILSDKFLNFMFIFSRRTIRHIALKNFSFYFFFFWNHFFFASFLFLFLVYVLLFFFFFFFVYFLTFYSFYSLSCCRTTKKQKRKREEKQKRIFFISLAFESNAFLKCETQQWWTGTI